MIPPLLLLLALTSFAAPASSLPVDFCATRQGVLRQTSLSTPGLLSERATGNKQVLVLRPVFPDQPADPFPESNRSILDEVTRFFGDNSFGKLQLGFTVAPTLLLPQTSDHYSFLSEEWKLTLASLALAQGYSLDDYDYCLVISHSHQAGRGRAEIGGKWSLCGPPVSSTLLVHELGHNLGLPHANAWRGQNSSITGDGQSIEYGNVYDVMGQLIESLENSHFNSHSKFLLGWLPPENVLQISASGIFPLHPLDASELNPLGHHAIRLVAGSRDYWVEHRARLKNTPGGKLGVFLLWGPSSRLGASSYLLDMRPSLQISNDPLLPGQSFSDPMARATFTLLGQSGDALEVAVHLWESAPNSPPSLELTSDKLAAAVDEPVTFTAHAADPDGDELSYFWMFSDGSFASGATVTHAFPFSSHAVAYCVASDRKGGLAWRHIAVPVGAGGLLLSGRVLSSRGPVPGVHIEADILQAYTDQDGEYLLPVAGPWVSLKASFDGMEFQPQSFANPLEITADRNGLNFFLPAFDQKLGLITTPHGYFLVTWAQNSQGCRLEATTSLHTPNWFQIEPDISAPNMYLVRTAGESLFFRLTRPY